MAISTGITAIRGLGHWDSGIGLLIGLATLVILIIVILQVTNKEVVVR